MRRFVLVGLATLSISTAAIHASVVREHLHEYAPFGGFFAALSIAELAVSALLVPAPSGRLLGGIAAGKLAIALLWVVPRTTGLPVGAEHWAAEPVQLKDAVCSVAECAVAAGSALARRRPLQRYPLRRAAQPA